METNDHIDARYIGPMHAFIVRFVGSRDDADDIAQQAFVNAWKHLKRYDPSRTFSTWLFAIAHNEAVNWLKKRRPDALTPDMEESIADSTARPDELALQMASARLIESGMSQLNELVRRIMTLRHDDGMTFREISAIIGEPLNTVKSRYRRALGTLRKFLRRV
jgi:RNA polymerase sigma-70 factor (ECF subfamily)